jgi:hypothetical protein
MPLRTTASRPTPNRHGSRRALAVQENELAILELMGKLNDADSPQERSVQVLLLQPRAK